MQSIDATEFKEQCLSILDQLPSEGLTITKGGKPVAWLMPVSAHPSHLFGALKNKVKIKGDIMSTGEKWNANQ